MSNTLTGAWSNAVVSTSKLSFVPSTGVLTFPIANVTTSINVVGTAVVNGALTVNNTAAVGNTTVTGFVNASSYGTFGGTVNATALNISGVTTTGNTIVTGFANISSYLTVAGVANVTGAVTVTNTAALGNTTVTGFVNASSYGTFNGTVNATALNIGANINLSTTQINVGNATVNTAITSSNVVSDSVYVRNKVGFANSTNISVAYQIYNNATASIDTVFG